MALAQTNTQRDGTATHRMTCGAFTLANGDTSGDIVTGLTTVNVFIATWCKSWTASGGTVSCVFVDPTTTIYGSWLALGL